MNDSLFAPIPEVKKHNERLFFVNNVLQFEDQDKALNTTKAIYNNNVNKKYAVVQSKSNAFDNSKINISKYDKKKNKYNIEKLNTINFDNSKHDKFNHTLKIPASAFKYIGNDRDNSNVKLFEAKLPDIFPRYLTSNFLNSDNEDIKVFDKAKESFTPVYFDIFTDKNQYQVSFRKQRRLIISSFDNKIDGITIHWFDRFKKDGIKILDFSYNKLTIQTEQKAERFLVYIDRYDKRWQATLDGEPLKIFRTNRLFKGVIVPEGKHEVCFRYHDPVMKMGVIVFTFSYLIAFCAVLFCLMKTVNNNERDSSL